ncbi:hypothetical protein Vretifemale_6457 [Volvox reticuliferus]|uniref:Uncharacterized protein n=1 Tax=Volvox reticuliferus TaxID=1737510 RepID=A0A8J4FMI3_9CHLO|nr:hypothetical protein Vretifemale_6457 [Volvox reticuliferus]
MNYLEITLPPDHQTPRAARTHGLTDLRDRSTAASAGSASSERPDAINFPARDSKLKDLRRSNAVSDSDLACVGRPMQLLYDEPEAAVSLHRLPDPFKSSHSKRTLPKFFPSLSSP